MSAITDYITAISTQFGSGQAREHAYRPALERLLSSYNDALAINDPKRSEHGNPDFIILKESNQHIVRGYAEAKDITIDLNKTAKSEQLRRYAGYNKLILTNYLDYRFYRNGEEYQRISIGKVSGDKIDFDTANFDWLIQEISDFLELPPEQIKSGKRLAKIMGGKAKRIRKSVESYLDRKDDTNHELEKMYKIMQDLLITDLTHQQFADMYAQTLVYGLFIARYNDKSPDTFSRQEARDLVSRDNPFLFDFFDHIAGPRFDDRLKQVVDELCEVFVVSDVHAIIQRHLRLFDFADEKDPVIHFYEDFLAEYDPAERKKMGAYYTPVPVVRFIIREVDQILKQQFGLPQGLADTSTKPVTLTSQGTKTKADLPRVQILDPAVGTATFLNEVIKYIYAQQKEQGQTGRWPAYAEQHLLPRLFGFELMMVPYTVAHLKLSMTLAETGVEHLSKRFNIYLTNTLEEGAKNPTLLDNLAGFAETISQEAAKAAEIKHEKPIMVVMGNPPYSGVSSNETTYANSLINKYKVEPGGIQKLQERKHWLNDDYVKFLAFAEDMIAKNGEGIVGMITNHGYLDNPTFRGMRWHLTQTFDEIYVLDLHGNTKKKETTPDGGKDQNVFDIQQGVAILLAIKTGKKRANQLASVRHAEIFGTRRSKFNALETSPNWQAVTLDKKMYYFVPKNNFGQGNYEKGIKLDELFAKDVAGVVTARDSIVTSIDRPELLERLNRFTNLQYSDSETRRWLFPNNKPGKYEPGDSRGWKLPEARRKVRDQQIEAYIKNIEYRPFDTRFIYYTPTMVDWGRFDFMVNMANSDNLGLIFGRNIEQKRNWADALITNKMITHHSLSIKEVNYLAPLYIYHEDGTRTANFDPKVLKEFTKNLSKVYEPEDILDYIYAVLYSPKYRSKYKEFLKTDFPRAPAPKNDAEFTRLVGFGQQLRSLHLMKSPELTSYVTTYPVQGSDEVEKPSYINGNVYINDTQYFGDVPEVAWNFYIGGYQPAQKWLKDRKGRELSSDDIDHYQKIIKTLAETAKIMQQIDQN
ncbi:MAG: type ISP restriction/modification enzyme [Candidatus Saccharimonadales bacterium]